MLLKTLATSRLTKIKAHTTKVINKLMLQCTDFFNNPANRTIEQKLNVNNKPQTPLNYCPKCAVLNKSEAVVKFLAICF